MALYTFYCLRPDGTALSFEAREHPSDDAAIAACARVLADHSSCIRVEVFDGDRLVGEAAR